MSDDLTARIVEATARAIVGADIMGSPEQARAALAAAVREVFRDPQEAYIQAAYATPPVAALLRALAEIADA